MLFLSSGSSMLPTFPIVSLIWVSKSDVYEIGDVVDLITLDKKHHCHRVVKLDSGSVSTKGDNLEQQWYEINVPIKNICGKITWSWPRGKPLSNSKP